MLYLTLRQFSSVKDSFLTLSLLLCNLNPVCQPVLFSAAKMEMDELIFGIVSRNIIMEFQVESNYLTIIILSDQH